MEAKTKVTKEVLCEESRFILANVLAEARYGRQNRYEDIRRVCEGAVSIPFSEYVVFLESAGYLRHDRDTETLEVSEAGEEIVNGGNLSELTAAAVSHFKSARAMRRRKEGSVSTALPEAPQPPPPPPPRTESRVIDTRPTDHRATDPRASRPPASAGASSRRPAMESDAVDTRYERLSTIGSGGIGTVFRARQTSLNRLVALKEIRDLFGFFPEDQQGEIVRRFTEVVRQGAILAHSNILPIHEANLDRDYPYVVTELAPFGSARRLITDAESIPVGLALKYLIQTLHALRAAHREGVAHRGLKPENMLIDAYGNVKVSDFGFARIVERDASVIRQVYVGMGAVAYMAPELFADPSTAGPQTDIYALGIIFYELLTSRLPGRRSPMPSEINSKLPKGLDDIFDTMTRDAVAERYSTVDDIIDDFDKVGGIADLLGGGSQVIGTDNPLKDITFRDGSSMAQQMAGGGDGAGNDVLSSTGYSDNTDDDDAARRHRPYSFQQRHRKP
ncbi:MAG TPA: serine/threonine-protein kinase [Kofleriaceae bacterium]|nr:serine/threonine-protein kinase [Kofleriaceae bacterium]